MKRQIIDCFPFFNELDLLKFRLTELDSYVDKFILVESTKTFTGNPKPLYYSLNKDLFSQWKDKIIHIVVTDMPVDMSPEMIEKLVDLPEIRDIHWVREHHQRRAISRGLSKLKLDFEDIILVSDLDEIPDLTKLDKIIDIIPTGPVVFKQNWFIWNINYQKNITWTGGAAFTFSQYLRNKDIFQHIRNIRWESISDEFTPINCGWHFSWFGDVEFIKNKMFSFAHTESADDYFNNNKNILNLISNGLPPQVPTENTPKLIKTDFTDITLPNNLNLIPNFNLEEANKIYDCFIINDEIDILNLRLHELNDYVDYFVIVEATQTHSGKPKPLHYKLNEHLFKKFEDKIYHIVVDGFPEPEEGSDSNWFRENFQRNQIKTSLLTINPKDNDFILLSDIDEIPHPDSIDNIDKLVPPDQWRTFRMRWLNWNTYWESEDGWPGTQAIRWVDLKKTTPQYLRNRRYDTSRVLDYFRGWHLSWFGGAERAHKKLQDFAHQELPLITIEEIQYKIDNGITMTNDENLIHYNWDYYPEHIYILDNNIVDDSVDILFDFI